MFARESASLPNPASTTPVDDAAVASQRKYLLERVGEAAVVQVYADGFDHLRLHVLGVHDPVWPDAAREPQREPAAPGAQIGDDRTVRDAERVHDLIGLLPGLTIGGVEQAEILGREQAAGSLLP